MASNTSELAAKALAMRTKKPITKLGSTFMCDAKSMDEALRMDADSQKIVISERREKAKDKRIVAAKALEFYEWAKKNGNISNWCNSQTEPYDFNAPYVNQKDKERLIKEANRKAKEADAAKAAADAAAQKAGQVPQQEGPKEGGEGGSKFAPLPK